MTEKTRGNYNSISNVRRQVSRVVNSAFPNETSKYIFAGYSGGVIVNFFNHGFSTETILAAASAEVLGWAVLALANTSIKRIKNK